MYRFNRQFVRELLLTLTWMRDKGVGQQELRDYCVGLLPENEDNNTPLQYRISQALTDPEVDYDEMIDSVLNQLGGSPQKSSLLIDKLADVIMNTYGNSILGVGNLGYLRNAILNPDEIDGLVERLNRKEMFCLKCSKQFEDYEAITFLSRSQLNGSTMAGFYCFRCAQPNLLPCGTPKCNHKIPLMKKIQNLLSRNGTCPECSERLKGGLSVPKPEEEEPETGRIETRDREIENAVFHRLEPPERPAQPQTRTATLAGQTWGEIRAAAGLPARYQVQPPAPTTRPTRLGDLQDRLNRAEQAIRNEPPAVAPPNPTPLDQEVTQRVRNFGEAMRELEQATIDQARFRERNLPAFRTVPREADPWAELNANANQTYWTVQGDAIVEAPARLGTIGGRITE